MEESHRIRSVALSPERGFRPKLDLQMGIIIDSIQDIGLADEGSLVGLGSELFGLLAQPVETERLRRSQLKSRQRFHLSLSAPPEEG